MPITEDQEFTYRVTCPRGHVQVGHAWAVGGRLLASSDCDFCGGCEDDGHATSYLGDKAHQEMRAGLQKQYEEASDV